MIKILGIEHIGLAVSDNDELKSFWRDVMGIKLKCTETVVDQGVKTDIFDTGQGKIELLHPIGKNSPISKYLKKYGQGIHHLCLKVQDINEAIKDLKKNNVKLIGDNYTIGAEGCKIIFIHPKSTGGILLELAEEIS